MKTLSKRKPGMSWISIEHLEPRRLLASPELLLDIEPGEASSFPTDYAELNGTVFFVKFAEPSGLWKTDGTPEGTQEVKGGLQLDRLTPAGDLLFFWANDFVHGFELWRSDGTTQGTQLVEDIHPGEAPTGIFDLEAVGETLFFNPPAPGLGFELWRSDGTEEGTHVVVDIAPGEAHATPASLTAIGGTLYFSANDGINGQELWISDGTAEGTELLVDINPGSGSSNPRAFVQVGDKVFFSADDGTHGMELWMTDGTAAGTKLVLDINPGPADSNSELRIAFDGLLYFTSDDGTHGRELWRSDGTAAGTELVRDIRLGSASSSVGFLVPAGDSFFFRADDGVHGVELWKSDGTSFGTQLVEDIHSGSSNPSDLVAIGETLYFTAEHPASGEELWQSDGTAAGTLLTADILNGPASSNPGFLTAVGSTLYFSADDGEHGFEPWILDTTDDGGGDGEGVIVDFESLPLGFIDSGVYEQDGFVFANVPGDGGAPTDRLRVDGANQKYESKILTTYNWARRIAVGREDGSPFSVERFDYAAGRWNEPGDFVLTGHFADGSTDTRTISFSNRELITLELNWEDVVAFDLNAAGGVNNAYFAVDNFVFNTPEDEGPPFITGSLADPDPVAGPARLRYDERTWHEVDDLVELSGGAFYAFGRSGEETWALPAVAPIQRVGPTDVLGWVTRHLPDGSIDRSFGDNGRVALDDLPWDGRRYSLALNSDRLIGRPGDPGEEHIAAFNLDLSRDTSFADNGILRPAVGGEPLVALNHAVFDDGGIVVSGRGPGDVLYIQIYSSDGALVANEELQPILDAALPPDTGGGGLTAEGSHDDGFIYLGLLKTEGDGSSSDPDERPFIGALRLNTDLEVNTAYGTDGTARNNLIFPIETLSLGSFFTGDDGRALIELREGDGDREFFVFDSDGESTGSARYFSSASFSGDTFGTIENVNFLTQGDVAVAYSFLQNQSSVVYETSGGGGLISTGFAVSRYDFGDPSGGGANETFFDPTLPAGLNDAMPTATGGFVLGGFLEDVEPLPDEDDPQVIDIDHVAALWAVVLS